jgi:DNA-binding LacI/PurR family transcriptional regulator
MNWLVSRQRYQGWKNGLETAGLSVSKNQIVEGDWSAISGERAMGQLLCQIPDIEAVFASNDRMALGALKAASNAGRRIPEDLALVGYDDVPEAPFFSPPLTTIRQDLKDLAGLAVEMVDRRIDARDKGQPVKEPNFHLYPPQLIIRQSSINHLEPATSKKTA